MKKLKTIRPFYLVIVTIALLSVAAAAQDILYISEPSVYDTPRTLPRFEAPVQRDFVRNPALLTLDCPWKFFSDLTYHGGTYKTSTGAVWGPDVGGSIARGYSDSSYYLHALGGNAGLAMRLSDSTNLAVLVSSRWGFLVGETDFLHVSPSFLPGSLNGAWDERLNSHTFGISLLVNHAFSDAFTLGTGLTYTNATERLTREGAGSGSYTVGGPAPTVEALLIDREIKLNYHRFAPVVGIILKPSDRFRLDASVESGFSFGRAGVESDLFDNALPPPTPWYSDDAESMDLFGWDIAAKVRPVITLSDRLSVPLVLDFSYRQYDWSAVGAAYGYFAPVVYGGIFQGPGTIDYENSMQSWDITAAAGLTYDAGWATLAGLVSYTHSNFRNGYDQENLVPDTDPIAPGLTAYSQRDNEIRDTVSFGVEIKKRFSPVVSAALGLRYDIGWAKRDYYTSYVSPYEMVIWPGIFQVIVSGDGRDMYQDLTLTTGLTLTPAERLTIAFGGMVKIPLDPLDYEMDTTSIGWPAGVTLKRFPNDSTFSRDCESSGWEYGGLLTITYEFGCLTATPPAIDEPKIAPILEPMSLK